MEEAVACYYGSGALHRLARYERVVLQPDAYGPAELEQLRRAGTQPLAYLSLTEDTGPPAPWQRAERNPDWGGALVVVGDPRWFSHVLAAAKRALDAGFAGLLLDQLNVEFTHPDDLPDLLALIGELRGVAAGSYLLANRGFALLPTLAAMVDGVLFESFTSRWVGEGYAAWPDDVLDGHAAVAHRLHALGVEVFALDYAGDAELAALAHSRAARFGMPCFVSDRLLTTI